MFYEFIRKISCEKKFAKFTEWQREQDKIVAEKQGRQIPNYGACGGVLTYEITPTTIGIAIVVRHGMTKNTFDLTSDDW